MGKKLTPPELLWNADFDGQGVRVYYRMAEDQTELQLMLKFNFQPTFQDMLACLATMVDDVAASGKDPILIHQADTSNMH